jgi:predicted nucleotidyltransferase
MTAAIKSLLRELRSGLQMLYQERLKGVYLYGSYARGEEHGDSDLDVLVVLDQIGDYGAEIDRTSEMISTFSLTHGVSVSRVFATQQDWTTRHTGFLTEVGEEAVAA